MKAYKLFFILIFAFTASEAQMIELGFGKPAYKNDSRFQFKTVDCFLGYHKLNHKRKSINGFRIGYFQHSYRIDYSDTTTLISYSIYKNNAIHLSYLSQINIFDSKNISLNMLYSPSIKPVLNQYNASRYENLSLVNSLRTTNITSLPNTLYTYLQAGLSLRYKLARNFDAQLNWQYGIEGVFKSGYLIRETRYMESGANILEIDKEKIRAYKFSTVLSPTFSLIYHLDRSKK